VRIERRIAASVAIGGSLLLALSGAVPALASGHSAGLARASGVKLAIAANKTSTLFGGWVFTPKTAKSVTSEFKIPSLKCTTASSGFGPISVLISGPSTAEEFNAAGLLLECVSGSPAAAAAVVLNGVGTVDSTNAVAVGDVIQSTVATTGTKVTATVSDLTKGHTFKFTRSAKGGAALQEEIIDDSLVNTSTGKQLPVANFGKLSFTKGAVSGKAIGTVTPSSAVNMVNKKKVLQILTGKITGTAKNTFLTTWKHS
jgi:hypothetical protein